MKASTRIPASMAAFALAAACAGPQTAQSKGRAGAPPSSPIAERHRAATDRILALADTSTGAFAKLEALSDGIGARLSGSRALEDAIRWAQAAMTADGLTTVHEEPVMVPHWERGEERGAIVRPIARDLRLLALGGSVGTPKGGITARAIIVRTYEELEKLADRVKGKIVVFDNPMPPYGPEGAHYGETVVFRASGAARAGKLGASAVLVRSVTARSLRSPHTGATRYDPSVPPIPAAAISTEDSAMIARIARSGREVEIHLELGARMLGDVASANVVGEIAGRELPEESVLIGAHLDSWDVGQGAHDDGSGCAAAIEALSILHRLHLVPRRTVRAVLFTNEENGLRGALAYAKAHASDKIRAAIEMDSGGFRPIGFDVETEGAIDRVRDVAALLAPIGAAQVRKGHSGSDVGQLKDTGAALIGLSVEGSRYFDYHHSEADTLDKVDPKDLELDAAALAVMAFVLAEDPSISIIPRR
jgi:carboxypeptidase Q